MARLDGWERALLAGAGLLWLACANAVPFGRYVDDVVWVLLSRRMLHGSLAADWSWFPRLETSATWGFSLLLAPAAALPGGALVLKAWCAALAFAGLVLFGLAVRAELPPAGRRALLAALFADGLLLSFSGSVMSEAGFLLLFGAAAYAALGRGWLRAPTPRRTAALALLCALLALTRLIGAAFGLAVLAELWLSRRRRAALLFGAAAAAAAAPYALANLLASGHLAYQGAGWATWSGGGAAAALSNARFYAKGLALLTAVFFPSFWPNVGWLKAAAAAGMWALALAGAGRLWRGGSGRLWALYFAICAAVTVCWPYQAPRFAVPLAPVFALWLAAGVEAAAPARFRAAALAAFGALALLSNSGEIAGQLRASLAGPADVSHEAESWLGARASPGDLVVSMDVARLRYYAGLRGIHFIPAESAEEFAHKARGLGARWFLIRDAAYVGTPLGTPDPARRQQDRLDAYLSRRDLFAPVYENAAEGARVYIFAGASALKAESPVGPPAAGTHAAARGWKPDQ